jgi:hypothetical protein
MWCLSTTNLNTLKCSQCCSTRRNCARQVNCLLRLCTGSSHSERWTMAEAAERSVICCHPAQLYENTLLGRLLQWDCAWRWQEIRCTCGVELVSTQTCTPLNRCDVTCKDHYAPSKLRTRREGCLITSTRMSLQSWSWSWSGEVWDKPLDLMHRNETKTRKMMRASKFCGIVCAVIRTTQPRQVLRKGPWWTTQKTLPQNKLNLSIKWSNSLAPM